MGREGQGLEVFLSRTWAEQRLFPGMLYSAGVVSAEPGGTEHLPVGKRREVGFVASVAFHLFIILLIALEPVLLAPTEENAELVEKPERLVLFMDEEDPAMQAIPAVPVVPLADPLAQGPEAELLMQEPPRNRLLIPRASRPAPPELQQEFQNSLPFSQGNSDEFYTDEETKDPGEEGEPGEEIPPEEEVAAVEEEVVEPDLAEEGGLDQEGAAEGEETGDSETKLADLLPKDPGFTYFGDTPETPETQPPPQRASPPPTSSAPSPSTAAPRSRADNGEGGEGGEGGPFEDIRRFLMGTRFHNLQGGLITGQDNTFYYDDKGADFVPWLMRLSAEMHRLWQSSHPYSAGFQAGHTAVGISVLRNGDIAELTRIIPSGVAGFDNFATGALRAADLLPLPDSYPDERFDIIIVFWFNEQPYDLFP